MKKYTSLFRILRLAGLALIIFTSACESMRDIKELQADDAAFSVRIQGMEQQGQYREAAELLLERAGQIQQPGQTDMQIRATGMLINAGMIDQANKLLLLIQAQTTDPVQQTRLQQLQSQILLHKGKPEQALALLPVDNTLPDSVRAFTHELRARSYLLSGNNLESARERIQLDPLLVEQENINLNRQQIWDSLHQLSPVFLDQMTLAPAPDILSGWLALVRISKTAINFPEIFESDTAAWKTDYPQHPAAGMILDKLMAHYHAIKKPEKLALILPLNGKLSEPASAIRDGFLAAYYQEPEKQRLRTEIKIYDSSSAEQSIQQLYLQAASEGAEFVIGPLDKQKVAQLASMAEFSVPVLTLNQIEQNPFLAENLFQFGLNPEDEARQIAERASLEGMVRAVSISPRGDWGERLVQAFSKRFQELGGIILEEAQYDFRSNDFSAPIKRLLNLDESEERFNRLRHALPTEIKFIPRRRQDVDFIFMAAFPKQARLIAPQLRFHHAADIPVYTTSSAYSGKQSAQENTDMNGVLICDSDWILSSAESDDPLRKQLYELWPQQMEQYARLFALGIDAYRLPGQLKWLHDNPNERYEGVTGRLHLNEYKQIQRTLNWGRFSGGDIKLIEDIQVKKPHQGTELSPIQ